MINNRFIGRKEEQKVINNELDSERFSAVLIYGRRRIGKTELITNCINSRKKEDIIFFTAAKTIYEENINRFSQYISDYYNVNYSFNNLNSILSYITEKSKENKTILIIDEYSYLKQENSIIDSDMQKFIDSNSNNSNLKLILSGSIVDIMKNLIDGNEPLYGRFSAIISLSPFNYYEAAEFMNNRTNEEKFELYSVFGGVPHYLKLIDERLSVKDNIINLFFSRNNVMESEIEILLNSELSKIETANTVLSAIGNSSLSYKEINQKIGKNSNGAAYILNKLVSMDIIRKEINIQKEDSNKGLYYINDNALLFYYTFVLPNRNRTQFMSPETIYSELVEQQLYTNYLPKQFEKVCMEYLIKQNIRNKIKPPFYSIGRLIYHDPKTDLNHEYDIVTKDKNGYIYYECKYINTPVDEETVNNTILNADNSSFNFYSYGFFSRNGYKKKKSSIAMYALDDLYL